jgi:hypothetical protein
VKFLVDNQLPAALARFLNSRPADWELSDGCCKGMVESWPAAGAFLTFDKAEAGAVFPLMET